MKKMRNQETNNPFLLSPPTSSAPVDHHHPTISVMEQCSSCGSTKRRSLFSSSQPIPKKPTLSPPSATAQPPLSAAFTKIPLPTTILRRTISQPIDSVSSESPPTTFSNPHSPGNLTGTHSPAINPCNLRRTISDPTPALIFPCSPENNTKITPPATSTETPTSLRQLLRRNSGEMSLDSFKRGESPTSKELKKMKEMLKAMSEWFSEAIQQVVEEEEDVADQEEDEGGEKLTRCQFNHNLENTKEAEDYDAENGMDEEAVSVKKTGECIKVEFKCPCGKGYQILLSGDACYYKLM